MISGSGSCGSWSLIAVRAFWTASESVLFLEASLEAAIASREDTTNLIELMVVVGPNRGGMLVACPYFPAQASGVVCVWMNQVEDRLSYADIVFMPKMLKMSILAVRIFGVQWHAS